MLTIEKLKEYAVSAEHAASADVQRFVAWVEGKQHLEAIKAELEAAGYVVTPPAA